MSVDYSAEDGDGPVTLATFPNGHDAHIARVAIESHGIEAFVHLEHGQYSTASPWVHLEVARRDFDLAGAVLERGPLRAEEGDAGLQPDDLRDLRLHRRLQLARWLLCAQALSIFPLTLFLMPLFVVPAGLALWSMSQPRGAFGVAIGVQVLVTVVVVAATGPTGFTGLIPLLAYYFAWAASVPNPPEILVSTPLLATPVVPIGDAWKVPMIEPSERPFALARLLRIAALCAALVWIGWLVIRAATS